MDLREEVNLQLRTATVQDEPAVTELLAACKLAPLDPGAQFGHQYILAVANNDRVIGVAGIELHGDDALLRSVVVDKDFRSLRIGATLAENRLDWARDRGIRAIYLLTDTAPVYWERFGFQRIDRSSAPEGIAESHEFAVACPASSVAMRMVL
jgi:amino-acid N-acetyltransferase